MRTNPITYLKAINALKYINVETLTIEKGLPNAKEHIRQFLKKGYIQEIYQYGKSKMEIRSYEKKLFAITPEGKKYLGEDKYKTPHQMSFHAFTHQVELVNSVMGIYWTLKDDFSVTVDYHSKMAKPRPDAIIRATHRATGKEYGWILELERSRTSTEIVKDKISLEKGIFEKFGMPNNSRILYVINTKDNNKEETERHFAALMGKVKGLPDYYRFAKYYDWKNFDKAVWHTTSSNKVNLIN